MSTKTGSRLRAKAFVLLAVVIVVTQVPAVRDIALEIPIIGDVVGEVPSVAAVFESDGGFAAAPGARSLVDQCTEEQVLDDRTCGRFKVVVIDARKMPYIARNIKLAWAEGKDFVLTKDSAGSRARRYKACESWFAKTHPMGSCDEYPFATSTQGGDNARTEEVHRTEQNCQGGTLSRAYANQRINEGDDYLVVISNPGKIATQRWAGQEVRPIGC